jgi:DNA-binding NarL/FixJ family response regulator
VIPFAPQITRKLGQDPTAREIEVLQLVADALVNREISERLFLSEETVKSHVRTCSRSFKRQAEPTP